MFFFSRSGVRLYAATPRSGPGLRCAAARFVSAMYAYVWVLSRICRPREQPLSAGRVRVHTSFECYNQRGYIRTWYVYKIFFFIFRLMKCTDVCFFSLSGVLFPREYTIPQLNETVKHDKIRESDRHDRLYMYIPSFALPIHKTTALYAGSVYHA